MNEIEGRFLLGSILVSFGITYILNAANIVSSSFWLFVSCLIVMEGAYYSAKGIVAKKNDVSLPLAVLFFGISELLFLFNLVYYSFYTFLSATFVSIGLGLIISSFIAKYSYKKTISGIVLVLFGALFSVSSLFNVTYKIDKWIRGYGIGILIILLGILVIFPPKKGEVKK